MTSAGGPGVLEAIAARARRLRDGLGRADGLRLGIVVEGGAMRAIVSGGALVGMAEAGLRDVFDVAYGSSAGAVNLAYFLSGRGSEAVRIYTHHAATLRFVNPLRIGRVLDLDHLFEDVIRRHFPIDAEALRTCATELKVSVTDARSGRNRLVSLREEGVDLLDALKASSAVPFYYGRAVRVAGGDYVDGLASEPLPVRAALAEGCTHVLLVLSARPGEGSGRPSRPGRHDIAWPERLLLRRHARGFRRAYLTRRRRVRRALELAAGDPRIHVLAPAADAPVPSRICRDRAALEDAFEAARRAALRLFG